MLDALEKEVLAEHLTVADQKGRDRVKSLAYKVARTKTTWDDAGADLVADQKKAIAAVDKRRKTMRDRMDDLKEKVRKPLTDWEAKDADRVKAHKDRIAALFSPPTVPADSADLRALRETTIALEVGPEWEEFVEAATKQKDYFLRFLTQKIEDAEAAEQHAREQAAEQARKDAELAELRRKVAAMQAEKAAAPAVPEPATPVAAAQDAPAAPVTPVAAAPAPVTPIEATPPADTPELAAKRRLFVALRGFDLSKEQAAALTNGIASGQLPHVQFTVQA
jgi:colicin import membrane protein